MILRSSKLLVTGVALVVIALLTIGGAFLYIWLAPRTYSAHVKVFIRPVSPNAPAIKLQDLPLGSFKHDRNLYIRTSGRNSLFEIVTFASTPEAAFDRANTCMRELNTNVRSQMNANVSIVEQAAANPRPVRPNPKAIFIISGVTALNLAFTGIIFVLVAFLKSRCPTTVTETSAQMI